MRVRAARTEEGPTLASFQVAMAEETEGRSLDATRVLVGVQASLADPAKGTWFVAEEDGEVLGALMTTAEWSDWRNAWFWWIQSVYVRFEHRGSGVYRALHEHVADLARQRGDVCGLRLYVERENIRARRTYEALGMERTPYDLFEQDLEAPPGSAGD
jgi:GNAT superfamily N-acetyltransferase